LALNGTTGSWLLDGGTINGGTITTLDTVLGTTSASSTLNGPLTLVGTLDENNDASVTIVADSMGNGLTLVPGLVETLVETTSIASLNFSGTQTLAGTGEVLFNGGNNHNNQLNVEGSGSVLTIGPNITIEGLTATLNAGSGSIVNEGTISANTSGGTLTLDGAATNDGTMEAANGGTLTIQSNANYAGGTLTGGAWKAIGGGILRLIGDSIATNAAAILLDGATSQIYSDTNTTNALAGFTTNSTTGSFTIQNGANLSTTQAFSNLGTVTIGSNSAFTLGGESYTQTGGTSVLAGGTLGASGAQTSIQGGTLSGPGTIVGTLINGGEVDLGSNPGTLTIQGDYYQEGPGTLVVKIGGATAGSQFDQVNVSGVAVLNGTLTANLINGFTPSSGQMFSVMTFAGPSGTFSTFISPQSGGTPVFSTQATDTSYNLVVNTPTLSTATSVSGDPNPLVLSQTATNSDDDSNDVTFTATVTNTSGTSDVPVGQVDFQDMTTATDLGTVPLTDGSASLYVPSFSLGEQTIIATYAPDPGSNFAGSENSMTEAVEASTTTYVAAVPTPGILGQPVSFTTTVEDEFNGGGTPTGSVQFQVDGSNYGNPVTLDQNGQATISDPSLALGNHSISASYTPTVDFAFSDGDTTETVDVGDFWTGKAGDNNWDTAGNWTDGVPQATYDVYINNLPAGIVINLGQADVANNVNISSDVTLSGGQLAVAGMLTDSALLTLTGGAMLSVPDPFLIQDVTVQQGSTLSGQGTVQSDLINDGEMDMGSALGAINVNGNLPRDRMPL
jgi:hypothetical protein